MSNKSYLERYNEEHSSVIASLNVNKRICVRLLGFLISSIVYFIIFQISKYTGLHDIQTQFLNTFVNYIMTCAYVLSFFFLVFYILYISVKSFKEAFDKVRYKIKRTLFIILDWLVILPICATVASFCFAFLFTFAQVEGDSMYPTIYNESTVFVSYLEPVEQFDIVVAYITPEDNVVSSTDYYIKRVIGMPGDSVTWLKGVLTINGKVVDETYFDDVTKLKFKQDWKPLYEFGGMFTYKEDGIKKTTYVIPDGYYFVMGDNRINSNDSRHIGLIPANNIEGVVKFEITSSGIERAD
ncbi:MAG: signal peptidase I [Erysipelotrichaceae bacterium]|nr:signal peptidase I [Erysipelotrichaceae bacterium]